MRDLSVRFQRVLRAGFVLGLMAILIIGCGGKGDPVVPDYQDLSPGGNSGESSGLETGLTSGSVSTGLSVLAGKPIYYPGEVLVVLNDGVLSPGASIMQGLPLKLVEEINCRWGTLYRLSITDGTSVEDMVSQLKSDSRVRFAEPNYIYYSTEAPYFPNDPMWAYTDDPDDPRDSAYDQWGLSMIGASIVWNESNGSGDVVVAIMDTGVRFNHEDLNENIWINEDEIPDNDIDDDLNGYIDDWWGWNCWDDNNDPYDDGAYAHYHGTACSGVTAAVQDNERGVSGVAPGVKIMAIKVDLTGAGNLASNVVKGMSYASVNRADIVSMSFRTYEYSDIMKVACDDAWDSGNGVILMGGIGNESITDVCYPNGYSSVMAIGGTCPFTDYLNPRDEKRITAYDDGYYWGSNYGDHLTVMGYGAQYTTTHGAHYDSYWDGYTYDFFGGTSCATPFSAGVMALIRSYFPTETPSWSWERIEQTADDLDVPGFDIQTGHGRVNALRAVYGSDRYSDLEDPLGFVPLEFPDVQVFDTIHDVPGNPYQDVEDLYRLTTVAEGYLIIDLDIFTWGENLDIALYSDEGLTNLVEASTGANHYYSSTESIFIDVNAGVEYFLKVYSPESGGSTTYGLRIHNASNDLIVTGESITPPFIHHEGVIIPFLKLTCDVGYQATLDEIIINKSGTLPNPNWAKVQIYEDTDHNGIFDDTDALIGEEIPPMTNRAVFSGFDIPWTYETPLVLFVACDVSETLNECTVRLSLESYKDFATEEGIEGHYTQFPIMSDFVEIGTDNDPPFWVTTIGAQTTEPYYASAIVGWNEADDLLTPPVLYNVYYTDTLPFDIGTATKFTHVPAGAGDTTDFEYKVYNLPKDIEHYFVVRAEDQVGNEDDNLVVVSCIPGSGGNPTEPEILASFDLHYPYDLALDDNLLLVADSWQGLKIFDRTDPVNLDYICNWNGDTVYSVCFDGSYAYCGGYDEFSVIDLSTPSSPQRVDYVTFWDGWTIDKVDNWVYCANYYGDFLPVEVTDPYNIVAYPELELGYGATYEMDIRNDVIYIAQSNTGNLALDRSTPSAPEIVNTFGSTYPHGLLVEENTLYSLDYSSGELSIYNLAVDPVDPPKLGGSTDGPGSSSYHVVILGDYAYVTRFDYGIVVFDISVPSSPEYIGDLLLDGAFVIATDGTLIYVLAGSWLYVVI